MFELCKCGARAEVIFGAGPRKVALCTPCWRQRLRDAEDMVKKVQPQRRRKPAERTAHG